MSGTTSYNNDKVVMGEVEYPANDPASGAFFQPDYKKNEDLKLMLDGSKDSLKLEAMKRIIGMIAKGRDASDLFPAVVKNVVSKNIEVKKLVYVYLVRYAEEQQDLALLSISTFQRALKDPNQLIRASALRVLSSIRVPMIVPIVMLAIRDSASDMSPYVRKTAAHAIPKLYSLDPEQKEELVSIIDKLLSDKAPLVVGSAAMAFSEVCGERMSLIHRSYRKLCSLLADVDEWGQLTLLNVLTVYAKTCFADPNSETYSSDSDTDKPFYESESDGTPRKHSSTSPSLDADHRLLLRAAKPLLQSRNSGVVLAVAQLFYHCGPAQELPPVAKAMVRLLRAPLEVQSVVLNSIAALTVTRRALFEPFLKSFFVRNSDPTHIKLLKLEILTNLATEASAGVILREFQTYVTCSDKAFAGATIQAIGRLAVAIHSETETCLNGLLHLLSSKDEWVVCEAVVVVKRVVGGGATSARAAVSRAAKLLRSDRLAGAARAAAVWLVAEHGAPHPRAAAVLAHMAASFADQDELVKLQLLSLAVKLSVTQPDTLPVCRYVVSLARYDVSYDVRDRARMLRRFIEPQPGKQLHKYVADIFLPEKPKPDIQSSFKDRGTFTVGSLSQYIGTAAGGYRPLPAGPRSTLAAHLRDTAPAQHIMAEDTHDAQKNKSFYSEPESSGSGSSSSSSEESSSEASSDEEESATEDKKTEKPVKETNNYRSSNSGTSDSESDSESESGSDSESEQSADSSEEEPSKKNEVTRDKKQNAQQPKETEKEQKRNEKSNLELLLELDEVASSLPTMTPTCGGFLSPQSVAPTQGIGDADSITPVGPSHTNSTPTEVLGRVRWAGTALALRWARAPHLYSHTMCAIDLIFTNHSANEVTNIRLHKKTLTGSRNIHEFAPIPLLSPSATATVTLGVDFADTIQPIEFTIISSIGEVPVSITPPVGELMRAVTMSQSRWDAEHKKLRGMTECDKKAVKVEDEQTICKRVFETANVAAITSTGDFLKFAGRMMSSQDLVLLSVRSEADSSRVTANCQNMAIASLLANQVAQALART
ncbi:AP-3 complex subunit beta-2 isoform X1 [Helicoverpa zea]|uniref:AP-3 complex subunit beta-2 isoform X1 n=2 Tax=Helicoverpa zea TaxID=7113 RepID=UPI001F56EDEB|nr:AP-3 complex subunit beta-2 isoform X1 [Helicoverpa zea]